MNVKRFVSPRPGGGGGLVRQVTVEHVSVEFGQFYISKVAGPTADLEERFVSVHAFKMITIQYAMFVA
jgi:hypothetical protein